MLNGYHIITLTHKTTALTDIGRVIPSGDSLTERLQVIKSIFGWEEIYCLSTCNRLLLGFYTEQTVVADEIAAALPSLLRPDISDISAEAISGKFSFYHGGDAVRHLFEVAAAMDSLVVGEREIVRQLREAYETSAAAGLTGDHFRLLLHEAVLVSKQVFNETGIGEKALSIVALAFQQMKAQGITPAHQLVLVGAGVSHQLLAKFLVKAGFQKVAVYNRTIEKAASLAAHFLEGSFGSLDDLSAGAVPFDALLVCTGAVQPVITPENYAVMTAGDTNRKVIVDLSVPHNVSAAVAQRSEVAYIEVEGLKEIAASHYTYREAARQSAEHLITARVVQFRMIWHERQVERSLSPMIAEIKSIKERALNEVFSDRVSMLQPEARELVEEMMAYMEKKSISIPVKTVKSIASRMSGGKPQEINRR